MKRCPFACLALLACAATASAAEVPVPTAAVHSVLDVNRLQAVVPSKLDLTKIAEEDALRSNLDLPPRFAIPERVAITPATHGTWEAVGEDQMLWRLRILGAEGATSLNLGFTRFKLPARARLLLYATDGTQITRAFTAADNEAHGELWTPVVVTRDLIVELTVPRRLAPKVELKLGWINQGYRGFGTLSSSDKSGSCNLDVECLNAGDSWRDEVRSVGVISTGGSTFCTGSLVNNTANNHKMYFVTAAHCGITSGVAPSLVVYWNYENSFCRTPGSAASGQPGDGTLTQFHTGSIFRAAWSTSDFTLVELDDPAVPAFNHHWAGWDRTTGTFPCSAAAPCTSIHHPSTDEKRITYVTSELVSRSYNNPTPPGNGTHLWARWATDPPGPLTVPGVTEPGSSGSPLYTAAGRFVGQLHGGPSSCGATGNNLSDYYGRFSVSWTGGGSNSTRASNWLDPGNTGAQTTNGIDFCVTPPVPTEVTATAVSPTQIDLSWDAAAGATSYGVLRSLTGGGPYTSIGTSATPSYASTGLECDTTYSFVVNASGGGICRSENSTEVRLSTQDCVCVDTSDVEPNNTPNGSQAVSARCTQISGSFLNDSASLSAQPNDYFRMTLPSGCTVTALLDGLSVNYNLYLYDAIGGTAVASSTLVGTAADQAAWTNSGSSAVTVYIRVQRTSLTPATYQLQIRY